MRAHTGGFGPVAKRLVALREHRSKPRMLVCCLLNPLPKSWPSPPLSLSARSPPYASSKTRKQPPTHRPTQQRSSLRSTPSWKGPSYETLSLTTARMGASCGFTFVEGEEYIVYSRDGATVNLCSRTRPVAEAEEDFKDLGEGQKPGTGSIGPTPEPNGGPSGSMSCGLASYAGHGPQDASALFMVSGLIWLGLRGRPPR